MFLHWAETVNTVLWYVPTYDFSIKQLEVPQYLCAQGLFLDISLINTKIKYTLLG
jgi:hypothetical protein